MVAFNAPACRNMDVFRRKSGTKSGTDRTSSWKNGTDRSALFSLAKKKPVQFDKLIPCHLDRSATRLLLTTEIPSAEWRDPENACGTIPRQGIL